MPNDINTIVQKNVDIYRETSLRYLGYANEVGEAFRSIIGSKWVMVTYGVATAYVFADTISKSRIAYHEAKNDTNQKSKAMYIAGDTLIWQMLASVIIPGYTINRTCAFMSYMFKRNKIFPSSLRKWAVTAIGLATIPLIIRPIDNLVDDAMDATLRKFARSSCKCKTSFNHNKAY